MQESEAYTLITTTSHHQNYDNYVDANSGKIYNLNVYLQAAFRRQYPELALTVTTVSNGKPSVPQTQLWRTLSDAMLPQSTSSPSHSLVTPLPPSTYLMKVSFAYVTSSDPPPLANPVLSPNIATSGAMSTSSFTLCGWGSGDISTYSKNHWKGRRPCRTTGRRMN